MNSKNKFAGIQVNKVMSRHVHVLMADDTIQDAVALMIDHDLTTIPVIDAENKCVGMLSRSDLTELFLTEDHELARVMDTERLSIEWIHRSLETCEVRQVKELMTYEVALIRENQSLTEACREMARKRIHHLPVVNDEEKVVGILSSFDVVRAVAE